MSKLTLSIDSDTIAMAKDYARRHKTSLSRLVAQYLAHLTQTPQDDFFKKLHTALLQEGYQPPRDTLTDLRQRHIARKYL